MFLADTRFYCASSQFCIYRVVGKKKPRSAFARKKTPPRIWGPVFFFFGTVLNLKNAKNSKGRKKNRPGTPNTGAGFRLFWDCLKFKKREKIEKPEKKPRPGFFVRLFDFFGQLPWGGFPTTLYRKGYWKEKRKEYSVEHRKECRKGYSKENMQDNRPI